ncbi:ABC transporter ATP-binding protein [Tengunoibacter tsumagoiensis]|uniref:Helicase n=1 Tax=Tengunoibacter tsumagoiensis TaxID=2014871 RepID=A0A402A4S3_9CHLR|nr:ABC transporter ATP-binding protein [Tengunoibacter tsumagoiensis]GCE14059.1 helicase [Tengunoibacter tsumagoiensis]
MSHEFQRYQRLLMIYLRPQWRRVLCLLFFVCAGIALSLINPQLLSSFIDAAIAGKPLSSLLLLAGFFLAVAFIKQVTVLIEAYVAENIALSTTNRLRADLMLHCLQLDSAFHTVHTPGELIERVDGDVSSLSNFFSRFLVSLLGNLLLLLGVLLLLYVIDWRIGLALSGFTLFSLIVFDRLRNIASTAWQDERQASAELFGFLEERLAGTEDVRSSGATTYMHYGLAARSRQRLLKLRRAIQLNFASWGPATVLTALGTALALLLGSYLFLNKSISIGTVYLIFNYSLLLNTPIEQIVNQIRDLQQTTGSINRIQQLFDTTSSLQDGEGAPLPPGALAVAFQDVTFGYVEDLPVLKQLQLLIPAGSILGLLGRTGSGKSTLSKLLVRLYDPLQGSIQLGGVDLRSLKQDELHARIGIVTQDVHILHTTVRNNLTLFDPAIQDERILEVLEMLGLSSWYHSLPKGLETRLAPGGSGLSAGEAQLIAFARVFLKDPSLVILDEASSRLDPVTERLLEQAIDRLLKDRTGIIIAHRLATVQKADHILILEQGACKEYGERQALAADPASHFAHLLQAGLMEVLA